VAKRAQSISADAHLLVIATRGGTLEDDRLEAVALVTMLVIALVGIVGPLVIGV
jgi:hypothetical protein